MSKKNERLKVLERHKEAKHSQFLSSGSQVLGERR